MTRQKEFVPDDVLERAMVAFWRSGYEGTSTAELAARMGIGKRSMYDTFGDKHALYLAALRRYITQIEVEKDAAAASAGTLRGALREVLGPPRQRDDRPAGCFAALAAADVTEDDEDVRVVVTDYFERSRQRVRSQIRRFAGRVPPGAEDVVVIACDAALGYRVRARSGNAHSRELDRLVDLLCEHV